MGCAIPVPEGVKQCAPCLAGASCLMQCVAAVDYGYPWDRLIARFKFQQEVGWSRVWAELMQAAPGARLALASADIIVPVPLTTERMAERGFNQAWEVARHLPLRPTQALMPDALVRLRATQAQHRLKRDERLANLAGVMTAHPLQSHRLVGRRVLLIDDVSTTGATLQVAGQALLLAGARAVSALVLARTPSL